MFNALLNPLGWSWVALVILTVPVWRAKARRTAMAMLGVAATLTLFGGTPLSGYCLARLEARYLASPAATAKPVQAVVVLGGGFSGSPDEPAGIKVSTAFDRVTAGMTLMDRGISTNLVLGGGSSRIGGLTVRDNEAASPWLRRRLPATTRLWLLQSCRDTHDEAVFTAALARGQGWRRIGLVTSAWHLPRSVATFERAGLEVVPIGASFEGTARLKGPGRWTIVPNTGDLHLADRWFHEMIGRVYYRLRGWT